MPSLEERVAALEDAFARVHDASVLTMSPPRKAVPARAPGIPPNVVPARAGANAARADDPVATDVELDSEEAGRPIRKDPSSKYWNGVSHVGDLMADCEPEYLDALAKYKGACAWANRKEGDPEKAKYADWDDRDARLARGFSRRLRAHPPAQQAKAEPIADAEWAEGAGGGFDDESDQIPF